MTNEDIIALLPNPDHLRDVIGLLQDSNPKRGAWNDWECHARILNVWIQNLEELTDKLACDPKYERICDART